MPDTLADLLAISAARHKKLCPRQVIGVRMGLAGAAALGLEVPRQDKRLLVILETDGCFASGVEVATSSTVGRRTLRIEDYGKVAATFIDLETETALRISPRVEIRQLACDYAPGASNLYQAMLQAYQVMPEETMFRFEPVRLNQSLAALVGVPGTRVNCCMCGEEIINQREVIRSGEILCRACAGEAYYTPCPPSSFPPA